MSMFQDTDAHGSGDGLQKGPFIGHLDGADMGAGQIQYRPLSIGRRPTPNELGRNTGSTRLSEGTEMLLHPAMNGSRTATSRESLAAAVLLLCGCATPHAPSVDEIRASAESGDSSAEVALGDDYAAGRGVTQSYTEAARWQGRAAD